MGKYTEEQRLVYAKSTDEARPQDIIHPSVRIGLNCSIGHDGFGWIRQEDGTLYKMPHCGFITIEKNVIIGNNVCIDRAVNGATIIGEGSKVDNLCHIAHGAKIGKHVLIVAGTIIGGSCEIGNRTFLGMNCSIKNKIKIGNDCIIGAGAVVLCDIPDGEVWAGCPAKFIRIA